MARTRSNYGIVGTASLARSGKIYSADDHRIQSSSGAWPYNLPSNFEILMVAGGGGGGQNAGGGGGAGGLLYYGAETPKSPNGSAASLPKGYTYTIAIGAGGASSQNIPGTTLLAGGNTTLTQGASTVLYTALGGGQGAHRDYGGAGKSGGSGGGGSGYGQGTQSATARNPGTGTSGQGNDGGTGSPDLLGNSAGAGGGGAGAVGGNAGTSGSALGGNGGVGLQYSISGTATYYAGGGGGHAFANNGGTAGLGGGGKGQGTDGTGVDGTINTGGGAGGGGFTGGSGIFIMRYSNTYDVLPTVTGTYTYTNIGGYHTYKFTGSGTFTF